MRRCQIPRPAVSESKRFQKDEKTTQVESHVASEICVCSTKYSLQEFLDAKKFCSSKTPRNLKRLVLKSKHAVSAQEIFLERSKKHLAHFFGKIN